MAESEANAASSRETSEAASTVEEESNASSFDAVLDGEVTPDTLKRSLEEYLANVKNTGSFATSGALAEGTLSGLSVHGVGSLGFPVQEGQAKAVIGLCHRAPFGQGQSQPTFKSNGVSLLVIKAKEPLSTNL